MFPRGSNLGGVGWLLTQKCVEELGLVKDQISTDSVVFPTRFIISSSSLPWRRAEIFC